MRSTGLLVLGLRSCPLAFLQLLHQGTAGMQSKGTRHQHVKPRLINSLDGGPLTSRTLSACSLPVTGNTSAPCSMPSCFCRHQVGTAACGSQGQARYCTLVIQFERVGHCTEATPHQDGGLIPVYAFTRQLQAGSKWV